MYFNKIYFSLLAIAVITGCKPEKKTVSEAKTHDTIHTNTSIEKEPDNPTKHTKLPVVDTTAVLLAFKKASETKKFGKDLSFDIKEDLSGSIFDSERPILIGDLNGDQVDDAIMPFSIEGRDGGNNWDAHYAVFINKDGQLQYQYSFDRGGDLAETQTFFKSIKDGVVKGLEEPGFHFPEGESKPVSYVYKNNKLELISTSGVK
ncbi:hypothetical protein C1637_14385 [Chryseobacterium lactis]|uniref:VCBS repeat-containing protein n=1 Tax=Chryseobacterium lactis TaxID=1241981 RepID=A0A3G6RH09_CHRLC|nr:hypothetical protein [Chryseobacterium lactis]AZA83690.1 hypothetical protein EG342_18180 [Chryseobacterium lactis]AZB04075.1 hypothetical protein EG341_09055 [Chryseobacterium lactis]PNW13017.1 hypothetical protein C1637_14385 [Chryseobacterium lactis]